MTGDFAKPDSNATPLQRFAAVDTRDPAEAEAEVGKIFCSHRLTPLLRGAPGFHAVHNTARYDGFSVNYVAYGSRVEIDPGKLDRFFLLQIPMEGEAAVTCGSVRVEATREMASLLSPTLPTLMTWYEGVSKLIVLIDRVIVEQHLAALIDRAVDKVEFDPRVPLVKGVGAAIRVQAELLREMAETIPSTNTRHLVQQTLRDALVGLLLAGLRHDHSELLQRPTPPPAPAHVKRIEDFIRAYPERSVSVTELANIAGVSLRTLQAGFRRFRGTTLTQMVREARLSHWRTLLQGAGQGASVTHLALAAGITHLGRAAAAYRQRYGETPSETLRRRR